MLISSCMNLVLSFLFLASIANAMCKPQNISVLKSSVIEAVKSTNLLFTNQEMITSRSEFSDSINEYNFAASRTIENLQADPKFKNCTNVARLVAYKLFEQYEVFLVNTVVASEFEKICLKKNRSWTADLTKWNESLQRRGIHASGHDLVVIRRKCSSEWFYFNPRDLIKDITLTKLSIGNPIQLNKKIQSKPVYLPSQVVEKQFQYLIRKGHSVPDTQLLIVSLNSPSFQHDYRQRINMIASGDPENPVCRYNLNSTAEDIFTTSDEVIH